MSTELVIEYKCANPEQCPLKDSCYRYLVPEQEYQKWANFFDPTDPEPLACEHFWEKE